MCKTLIYNTQTNQVASLYVDAPLVVVKSRQHDTSLYASLTTNTNPSRPPFRRRLNIGWHIPKWGEVQVLRTYINDMVEIGFAWLILIKKDFSHLHYKCT